MNRTAAVLILSLTFTAICFGSAFAQQPELGATVTAVQGSAQVYAATGEGQKQLREGSGIEAWDTVTTDAKSKLELRWQNGLIGAVGEFSSMVLASEDMEGVQAPSIQVINGVFRFAGPGSRAGVMPLYSVSTPLAAVYPAVPDEPADFTVESYDPKTTVVSVMSGQVRVVKSTGEEKIVPSCHSYFIEEGKAGMDPFPLSAHNFQKLVENTTIPGTLAMDSSVCGPVAEAPPPKPRYDFPTDYYVEDWDVVDYYPYEVIVTPPVYVGGGYVVVIPGIGKWVIVLPYSIDPFYVKIYCQQLFMDHYIGYYNGHMSHWRHRQQELAGLVSLARMTGNTAMLLQAQRQLDDLNFRTRWAEQRILGLENKKAGLGADLQKIAGKLPPGAELRNAIAASLNDPKNAAAAKKFQDRLKTDVDVQKRLANVATQEVANLNRKIAAEKDPAQRLALREQLSGLKKQLDSGKVLIPGKDKQVGALLKDLGKEKNVAKRVQIEDKVLNQLKKVGEGPQPAELLNKQKLGSIKQDLAKFPNPQGRKAMEKQLATLQQSVEKRQETEAVAEQAGKQLEKLSQQAAKEQNPEKRNQLLNKMNDLSKSVPGVLPGRGIFMPQPNAAARPTVEQQPPQQIIQKKLEEQKKFEEKKIQPEVQQPGQKKLDQQLQEKLRRQQAVEQQKQQEALELQKKKQQEELKKQQLRQQQLEGQKQLELKKQEKIQQEELRKQEALQEQKKQEDLKKQQLLRRQEQQKQLELKKEEELKKQQLLRQQEQQKQLEMKQQQQLQQQLLKQKALEQQKKQQQIQIQQQQQQQQQLQLQQRQRQQQQLQLQQQQQQQMRRMQEQPQQLPMKQQPKVQQPFRQQQVPQQQMQQPKGPNLQLPGR